MQNARRPILILLAIGLMLCTGAGPATAPALKRGGTARRGYAFLHDYHIAHYLELAVRLQKLDPDARAKWLRDLTWDDERASEIYPLCRMLFDAAEGQSFQRPKIGGPSFFDGRKSADWPLEPITLYEGIPILVARGYAVGGAPAKPESYVEYCLDHCRWREQKFAERDGPELRAIVERFIAANPATDRQVAWLRQQVE